MIKVNSDRKFPSRSCVLRYGKEKLAEDAFKLFERALNAYVVPSTTFTQEISSNMSGAWVITALFIGASNISAAPSVSYIESSCLKYASDIKTVFNFDRL